jgi:DNA-binding response OmpR family regulator
MGLRALIIEDDQQIGKFLEKGLKDSGFVTDLATDGLAGLEFATAGQYDIFILDIMLPKIDGLSLIEKIREKEITTPVLILSAKRSLDDRVTGLQRGGDDYLTKPFAFSELLARVQALLRRSNKVVTNPTLKKADVELNLISHEAFRSGKRIELQSKEFCLLEYLMKNSDIVLSKTQILERVWNYQFDPQTNVVDVLVCRLRNKIDKDFEPKRIQTIRCLS